MKFTALFMLPVAVITGLLTLPGVAAAVEQDVVTTNTTDTAGLSTYRQTRQRSDLLPAINVPLKPPEESVANDNLAFSYDRRPELRTMTAVRPHAGIEFITLPHIYFNHDGFRLSREAKDILDGAAQYVYEHDSTIKRILIQGYTSNIADVNYNYRLSDRRVYAVWDYLAAMGVPLDLMSVHGWGETRPIDENWTRNGRQRNRHVEIQIVRATTQP
jgi:outer membrane protein OmpA-like peptidoglycan-associated protein